MRGIVFTEFLDFVDQVAGPQMTEKMLASCDLGSGGAYTSVGDYDHGEMISMLTFLNTATGQEVSEMVQAFGQHLFGQLADSHGEILGDERGILDFLEGIESHIHAEVRKLYPTAELPSFETERASKDNLIMIYKSARPFADLAYGMILGAADYFGSSLTISRKDGRDGENFLCRFEVAIA